MSHVYLVDVHGSYVIIKLYKLYDWISDFKTFKVSEYLYSEI